MAWFVVLRGFWRTDNAKEMENSLILMFTRQEWCKKRIYKNKKLIMELMRE